MKIKKAQDLGSIHPLSQTHLVFWIKDLAEEPSFWSRCYEVLSRTGSFRVICEPDELDLVCQCLSKAGFQELELNAWAFKAKGKEKAGIAGWEGWGDWFLPSWKAIVVARKRGKPHHKASLVSFFQKPLGEKKLVKNLKRWGTGAIRSRGKADLILIHGKECASGECAHGCSIHTMDLNREEVSPSQFFGNIRWSESELLDALRELTTTEGGECLESYKISGEDFSKDPDNYYHSMIAQGNPESSISEISRCLRPGGFYVRLSSEKDTIGISEDSVLRENGFLYRGRMALIFEGGACYYTSSNRSPAELFRQLKVTRETSLMGSLKIQPVEKNLPNQRGSGGGIFAMFGEE